MAAVVPFGFVVIIIPATIIINIRRCGGGGGGGGYRRCGGGGRRANIIKCEVAEANNIFMVEALQDEQLSIDGVRMAGRRHFIVGFALFRTTTVATVAASSTSSMRTS